MDYNQSCFGYPWKGTFILFTILVILEIAIADSNISSFECLVAYLKNKQKKAIIFDCGHKMDFHQAHPPLPSPQR